MHLDKRERERVAGSTIYEKKLRKEIFRKFVRVEEVNYIASSLSRTSRECLAAFRFLHGVTSFTREALLSGAEIGL